MQAFVNTTSLKIQHLSPAHEAVVGEQEIVGGIVDYYFNYYSVEKVAIANALQLEADRCRAVPMRFNFVARAKFEVSQPIRCCLRAFYC